MIEEVHELLMFLSPVLSVWSELIRANGSEIRRIRRLTLKKILLLMMMRSYS